MINQKKHKNLEAGWLLDIFLNKFNVTFIICTIIFVFRLQAQHASPQDSLTHLFISDTTFTTEERLNLAYSLIDIFSISNPEKADEYTLDAIEIATKKGDTSEIIELNLLLAKSKNNQCNYPESDKMYQLSKSLIEKTGTPQEIANINYLIANNYFNWSKYTESKKFFDIAILKFQELKDKYGIAKSLMGLSAIASNHGDYELAIGHMQRARDIYIVIDDPSSLVRTTIGLGVILESWGKYDRALAYYEQAFKEFDESENKFQEINMLLHIGDILLKQKKFNEALDCFNKAVNLEDKFKNLKLRSICYSNIGEVYFEKKDYDTALYFQEKSLSIKNDIGDKKRIAISLLNIGEIHLAILNINLAEEYILKSLKLSKEINYKEVEMESLLLLAKINKEKSNYADSYDYLTQHMAIKDMIFNLNDQSMINEFFVKYESEKFEKENEILRQKASITTLELQRQKDTKLFAIFFLVFIVVISLIIIQFIYLKSRLSRKNYAILAKKNKEITEQKEKLSELNKNLEYSKEQYRSIVENATIGMYQTNINGRVLYANSGLIKMMGYKSLSDFKKLNLSNSKNRQFFIRLLEEHHIISGREDVWTRQDGSSMFVNESAWIAKDNDGEILHYEGIVEDITKRKEAEIALKHSREELQNINLALQTKNKEFELAKNQAIAANEIKSQFIANVSHEIRTPMNSILGFTDLLSKIITDKKHLSYISAIKSSSSSLLTLINDVLDLSKIQAGEIDIIYEPVSLNSIVKDIKQVFKLRLKEKNLSFIPVISQSIPDSVFLDKVRIRQVLFNLIANAIKFTDSGNIHLEISGEQDKDTIDLLISITDSGIGISKLEHETIFEAFKQSKTFSENSNGGTGLGLSITKRLIEVMGGSISVKSKLGEGSTFNISLTNIEIAKNKTQTSQKHNRSADEDDLNKKYNNAFNIKLNDPIVITEQTHKELVNRFEQRWDKLNQSHIINDIAVFGEELLLFGKTENNNSLINFSEALIFYANNYDIEIINQLMSELRTILKSG